MFVEADGSGFSDRVSVSWLTLGRPRGVPLERVFKYGAVSGRIGGVSSSLSDFGGWILDGLARLGVWARKRPSLFLSCDGNVDGESDRFSGTGYVSRETDKALTEGDKMKEAQGLMNS